MRGFCLNCGKERELEIFSICEICKRKVYSEEIERPRPSI